MNYMFRNCSSLSSLPDLSKWDTSHLENNDNMFDGCNKLLDEPVIRKKEKGFFGKIFG